MGMIAFCLHQNDSFSCKNLKTVLYLVYTLAGVVKLVDALDSKSSRGDSVRVRFPPPAYEKKRMRSVMINCIKIVSALLLASAVAFAQDDVYGTAGIYLDTTNFKMHTSIGTHEASIILSRLGADEVKARDLLKESYETFALK